MMAIEISLTRLRDPNITEALIQRSLETLQRIIDINREKFQEGFQTQVFLNRRERLIQRLHNRKKDESIEQIVDVVGKERLLLSIYMDYLGEKRNAQWLPEFDETIARFIMGNNGRSWHLARRWQIILLFFTHFDRIQALPFVCERIRESFTEKDFDSQHVQIRAWHSNREILFDPNGTRNVVAQGHPEQLLESILNCFSIPKHGRFAERVFAELLLRRLEGIDLGREASFFEEIESHKERRVSDEMSENPMLLGSAALKIMIQRIIREKRGIWPENWTKWITRFGCDPRYGRSTDIVSKWWGWAKENEFRIALQGVTGLTIRFFIEFLRSSLKGTGKEVQFNDRSKFLLALFQSGKIEQARMIVHQSELYKLDRKYHQTLFVSRLIGTTKHTSMICLKCIEDVYLIEGTHTFGLRAFRGYFPIHEFWEHPREEYQDHHLRITPSECPIFLRHHGDWIDRFFGRLRADFHVEWRGIRV